MKTSRGGFKLKGGKEEEEAFLEELREEERLEKSKKRRGRSERVRTEVFIPNTISVDRLAVVLGVRMRRLQLMMVKNGLVHNEPNHILSSEDASMVAEDMGFDAKVDVEKSFDLYPAPIPADMSSFPLRPPIVTIMGHVDHGKTTLLDTLRKASVAKGEAGGITQHIGAFSVSVPPSDPNSDQPRTICFLDTPGHAAFTAMRARGAQVTDIIILVVAADDGVMPQSREVIKLVEETPNVQLVVAINKVDKHQANVEKIKSGLATAGVILEDLGGEVPSVEVSGLTGLGLDTLMETVSTLAEVAELRAEVDMPAEGFVLESQIEKGRGIVATCLIVRGTLKPGALLIAGTSTCKVRTLMDDKGKTVKSALPGFPVVVTGWKEVPSAGDAMLQASSESEVVNAVRNRQRQIEFKKQIDSLEEFNEKRRLAAEAHLEDPKEWKPWNAPKEEGEDEDDEKTKELRLFVKGDVSGSVEAVVQTLKTIGNEEAKVVIVGSGVGDVSKSDVDFAEAAGATIIGFSVKADRQVVGAAAGSKVPILLEKVIYRLVEQVISRTEDLLPPIIEFQVVGEATVQAIFEISVPGKKNLKVAGCRVFNGTVDKKDSVRVMRNEEEIYMGTIDTLKRVKADVTEVGKGTECGMNIHGFTDLAEGDILQVSSPPNSRSRSTRRSSSSFVRSFTDFPSSPTSRFFLRFFILDCQTSGDQTEAVIRCCSE
ncbi:hypothetical protein BDY24DRAFT_339112 [Mrakia frigida]|uniref:translation initiation factor 2 n=1 Tax=Mrakia frigida TaxID=29902 RepID=UPI003FCC2720